MAILNFSIIIPDGQVNRVSTALKAYLGNPGMTNQQAIDGLRAEFIARLKNIVAAHDRSAALAAAETANYDVNAT